MSITVKRVKAQVFEGSSGGLHIAGEEGTNCGGQASHFAGELIVSYAADSSWSPNVAEQVEALNFTIAAEELARRLGDARNLLCRRCSARFRQ